MAFALKSILSDVTITPPVLLSFPLAGNIFFRPLTFNLFVSFALCRQHIVGSFLIQSGSMCLFFLVFRAVPSAYGGSQARDPFGVLAAGLHHSHSNTGSSHICNLYHISWQHWILNPLNKSRDRTCILMDAS